MTKPEIEKLTEEFAEKYKTPPRNDVFELAFGFQEGYKAGYLKGVEVERKRFLDILDKSCEEIKKNNNRE